MCTGYQKFESKEAKIVKLMDSESLIVSIVNLELQNYKIKEIYRPQQYEYVIFVKMKSGNPFSDL